MPRRVGKTDARQAARGRFRQGRRRSGGLRAESRAPHGRGRPRHGRLHEAARGRNYPGRGGRRARRRHQDARQGRRILAVGPAARDRGAIESGQRLSRSVDRIDEAHGGRRGGAGGDARAHGPPLHRSGMVAESVLRRGEAGLSHHQRLGHASGARRQGPRSAHAAEGGFLREADRGGDLAVQLRVHQSADPARDAGVERGKPRARHEDADRGHRGRPRRAEIAPVRREQVRDRPQPRAHARQGGVRERADAADPVFAGDRAPYSGFRC